MWLAHALTLSRIPIAVLLWSTYGDPARSLALVVIAALTDAADGTVARWAQRRRPGGPRPSIGTWLDPLADKVFVVLALGLIWIRAGERLAVVLIAARELLYVPLAAIYLALRAQLPASRRLAFGELRAAPIGKAATIAQLVALAVALVAPAWAPAHAAAWTLPAAIAAAALGAAAAARYAVRVLRSRR
jgi:phosphatidylglycerophosphate synthase